MPVVELSPGFLFFLALLAQFAGTELFWPYLAAALTHELGHLAALWMVGGRLRRLRLGFCDLCMDISPLPPLRELLTILAGPLANLLCTCALGRMVPNFAVLSLLLAAYNLLPLRPLDGGRALYCLMGERGSALTNWMENLLGAALLAASLWSAWTLRIGFWPLALTAGVLLRLILLRLREKAVAFPSSSG